MQKCINTSAPEFLSLKNAFGEINARAITDIFQRNSQTDMFPTVEAASIILNNLQPTEPDAKLEGFSNDRKIFRILQQRSIISAEMVDATVKQKQTLEKLDKTLEEYLNILQNNVAAETDASIPPIATQAATKFIGKTEFKTSPLEYEKFKLFGTFVHEVIEQTKLLTFDNNKPLKETLSREEFNKMYDNYVKRTPFFIDNLTIDEIYAMTVEIVNKIVELGGTGYKLLPEITVIGKSLGGTTVVGRLDLVMISPGGKLSIIDFKTKKVHNLVTKSDDGTIKVDELAALNELSTFTSKVEKDTGGTPEAFIIQDRTEYDKWMLQLELYSNMLAQHGIQVEDKQIIALLYQANKQQEYEGAILHHFSDIDFYQYTADLLSIDDEVVEIPSLTTERMNRLLQAVRDNMPTTKTSARVSKEKTAEEVFDFIPEVEQAKKFNNKLSEKVDAQLNDLKTRRAQLQKLDVTDQSEIEALTSRIATLENFKALVIKSNLDNPSAMKYGANFQSAVNSVDEDIKAAQKVAEAALKEFNDKTKSFEERKKYFVKLHTAYRNTQVMHDVVSLMEEFLAPFLNDVNSKIKPDSMVVKQLSNMRLNATSIKTNYVEAAIEVWVHILQSRGEETIKKVQDEIRNADAPRREYILNQIEKLKKEPKFAGWARVKNMFFAALDPKHKEKIAETLDPEGRAVMMKIDEWQMKLKKLDARMDGFSYDEETLRKYITGIVNEDAINFAGVNDLWNNMKIMKHFFGDDWIAPASSSNPMIAMTEMFLKETTHQAEYNLMHDIEFNEYGKLIDELRKKYSLEELNAMVSERRRISFYNYDTKQIDHKNVVMFKTPYSEEYQTTYTEGELKIKELSIALNKARNAHFKDSKNEELLNAYMAAKNAFEAFKTEHLKWKIANCNLPYVFEFYALQAALPEEIREKQQLLYYEREVLQYQLFNTDEIDESDIVQMQLDDIEVALRRLKEEAKEQNPEYATYLERFNELYEFDIDENRFKILEARAQARFSDDPEALRQWYKKHTVSRPTLVWYNEISAIYDEFEKIFSRDPQISSLMQRRADILRPLKIDGHVNPRFLTDDEISEIDAINAQIEELILLRKAENQANGETLSDAEREMVAELTENLNAISVRKLSPHYTRDFEDGLSTLEGKKKAFEDARYEYANESNPEKKKELGELALLLQEQFYAEEKVFKQWYNKLHENEYQSILSGVALRDIAKPKQFNYERVVRDSAGEMYVEHNVPNPKYYKKKTLREEVWYAFGSATPLSKAQIQRLKDGNRVQGMLRAGELIIKDGAYNKQYIKGKDEIPLPKGIAVDENNNFIVTQNSKNINQSFVSLFSNKDALKLYNTAMKLFFNMQKGMQGKTLGYLLPGITQSSVQNIVDAKYNVAKFLKHEINKFGDANLKTYSEQDIAENVFGDTGTTRMRYGNQLSDNLQTTDALGSLMKYAVEVHMHKATQEIAPLMAGASDYLKLLRKDLEEKILAGRSYRVTESGEKVEVDMKERLRGLSKVIDMVDYGINKHLFGRMEDTGDRKLKKQLNALFGYIAFTRLGFDLTVQTKNFVSGNVQAYAAANGYKSNHFSDRNYFNAKRWVYSKFLPNYFKDWGRMTDLELSTLMYRNFNPLQKEFDKYYHEVAGGRKRRLSDKLVNVRDLAYILQDKGDTEIGMTVMYAVLDGWKVKLIDHIAPDGTKVYKKNDKGEDITISAHEVYYKDDNGMIAIRPDADYDRKTESNIRNIIYSEIRRAQGNYAKSDQTKMESTSLGKAMFFFRKFLIPLVLNRFGYVRPNWEAQEVAYGYWRAVYDMFKYFGPKTAIKEFLVGTTVLNKVFKTNGANVAWIRNPETGEKELKSIGDLYSRKAAQARRDAVIMSSLTFLSMLALAAVRRKDDDDDEISVLEGNLYRILWGTKNEATAMFPIGTGSEEYIKNFTTAIPMINEMQRMQKALSHGFNLGLALIMSGFELEEPTDYDSEYYDRVYTSAVYQRKSGQYEKGDLKITKDLVDLTGYKNIRGMIDPGSKIDYLKRNL